LKAMKRTLSILLIVASCFSLQAQQRQDTLEYSLNARITPGFGKYAPFLSTVNQYDRHSLTPNSLSTWGTLHKIATRKVDYGFGMELNANLSPTENRLFPGELYLEGKIGHFLANVGMKRETTGNQDAELSSGGLIGSRNSRPFPALTLETDGWVDVPFTKGFLEFNGGMANGWFSDKTVTTHTLMHHKWLYGRLGGSFPLSVNYGFQHVAQWAGNSPTFGSEKADLNNFMRVFLGRSGSANGPVTEYFNTLGNHIISQNVGLSLHLPQLFVDVYWQDINEDKPILWMNKAYNKEDGLWGITLRLPKFRLLHSMVAEFLSTTDQNGPWHDMDGVIYGGTDNYYNNAVYPNGWSLYGMTIGNPWLTSPKYNTDGGVGIENNCVRLWYFSGLGTLKGFNYHLTTAYSHNWGLEQRTQSTPKKQFSGQLEVFHALPFLQNTEASLGISGDRGTQYGNNFALLVGVRYTGQIILHKTH